MLAYHFQDRVHLLKESSTWGLALINETELPADLVTIKPTGSRAKKVDSRGFGADTPDGGVVYRESPSFRAILGRCLQTGHTKPSPARFRGPIAFRGLCH